MPLFPAYATGESEDIADKGDKVSQGNGSQVQDMVWEATESREAELLASDPEGEEEPARGAPPPPPPACREDFYLDCKLDRGNLRVSTLYYPGRPQYERSGQVLVAAGGARGEGRRARRYWARCAADAPDATAAAARAAAYTDLLRDRPYDIWLWEQYIDFQEVCSGAEAALAAAEAAAARAPRSRRLRARLLGAARAALPRDSLLQRLRDMLAEEKCPRSRTELWCTLVEEAGAAGGAGGGDGAGAARAVCVAALADTRTYPPAYPRLLHAYGVFLRTAGLWEELVLLAELAAGMAGALPPPAPPAPPPPAAERRLLEAEERALASRLPLSALWVRVERARAAAHWRPAPAADPAALAADPQRAPLAHEMADLLRPLVGAPQTLLLCGALLRLAKVPLLPMSGYSERAWGAEGGDCGEALLGVLRAARRLPPAHPARAPHSPDAARRLLATLLDPPHYFTDDTGYLSWVREVWEACCGWAGGARRAALLAWRLRWLHALLPLAEPAGRRELLDEARAALRRHAAAGCGPAAPLAFAQFARLERAAGAPDRAERVAARALRAALLDADAPRTYALYVARIVCEVSPGGASGAAGASALVAAVCGRPPPPEPRAPAPSELAAALQACEERCAELERRYAAGAGSGVGEGEGEEGDEAAQCLAALLPAEAEWGAARALLAPPARRARLLQALPGRVQGGGGELSADAERYYEQSACALLAAGGAGGGAGGGAALALAQLFPHNAYLSLAAAGAPLWSRRGGGGGGGTGGVHARPPARTPAALLGALLPPLLRAEAADWAPQEAEVCVRAVRRAAAGAGGAAGALLGALRLEAEGRAPRPRLLPALYDALDRTPHAKWVYVRGAAWCGGQAGALADALLERRLRAHALLDELAALVPDTHTPAHTHTDTPAHTHTDTPARTPA